MRTDASRDPLVVAMTAILRRIPGIWRDINRDKMTAVEQDALDRLIAVGFVEERGKAEVTMEGFSEVAVAHFAATGPYRDSLWTEILKRMPRWLDSEGKPLGHFDVFTVPEAIRLTTSGDRPARYCEAGQPSKAFWIGGNPGAPKPLASPVVKIEAFHVEQPEVIPESPAEELKLARDAAIRCVKESEPVVNELPIFLQQCRDFPGDKMGAFTSGIAGRREKIKAALSEAEERLTVEVRRQLLNGAMSRRLVVPSGELAYSVSVYGWGVVDVYHDLALVVARQELERLDEVSYVVEDKGVECADECREAFNEVPILIDITDPPLDKAIRLEAAAAIAVVEAEATNSSSGLPVARGDTPNPPAPVNIETEGSGEDTSNSPAPVNSGAGVNPPKPPATTTKKRGRKRKPADDKRVADEYTAALERGECNSQAGFARSKGMKATTLSKILDRDRKRREDEQQR